jgi:cell division protease FtsH
MLVFLRLFPNMADKNKMDEGDPGQKRNAEFKMPPRAMLLWLTILCGVLLLMYFRERLESPAQVLSQYDFMQKVDSNLIAKASINYNPQSPLTEVTGTYYQADKAGNPLKVDGKPVEVRFRTKARLTEKMEEKLLAIQQFEPRESNLMLTNVLMTLLPFVIIAAFIWFFFIRQIKLAGKGALSFGKSKARLLAKERNKTTFKDVAGVDEAIEEVSELAGASPRAF